MSKPWSRSTRYLVLILALIISALLLYQSRALLGPMAVSALLAFILNPLVSFAHERMKLRRSLVVLLVYLASLAGIVLVGVVVVQVISAQTTSLVTEFRAMVQQIETSYLDHPWMIMNIPIQPAALFSQSAETAPDLLQADVIFQIFQATTTNIGWVLVVIVTTYYLLLDWNNLREWFFRWLPEGYEGDGRRLYEEVRHVWRRYFQGQLRLSVIVGFLTAVGALIIGLPGAVVFGILAAVFDVLLSVGPAIVIAIATAVALFTGSSTLPITSNILFALLVLALLTLIQMIENFWLRPRIMSNSLNIHPAIVFIAIIASLALAGVLTALVIVPVIVSVGIIVKYIYFKLFEMDPWENW
ncbi:MAG TPA: AI-2E family transporter [Chloroflexota bacterium]|nr:AI-2E family transporter [Chloroflexota bacterium]HUM69185.1 AI-2E family transporter [Chloroflexota bacterium]